MQTFLPYECFLESLQCLDYRRLGKQRVEAMQILRILRGTSKSNAWINHPAVLMWEGYEEALTSYMNFCIDEWVWRGYKNSMQHGIILGPILYPPWLGDPDFHASHRSNLLRKDYDFYSKYNWTESLDLPYVWPV